MFVVATSLSKNSFSFSSSMVAGETGKKKNKITNQISIININIFYLFYIYALVYVYNHATKR